MNLKPEFRPGYTKIENCEAYSDGGYLGKVDIEFVFDFSAFEKLIAEESPE
jgi:hypothetical protein